MPLKQVAVVRWTGRGRFADLRSSVESVLEEDRAKARVEVIGKSVMVTGPEPVGVAARLWSMPGVAWVAAGIAGSSLKELGDAAAKLGKSYLRRGDRFSVEAEGNPQVTSGDLAGIVTSRILEAVKGARVSESPKVRFRTAVDGKAGVVGVQLKAGVGGVPTGREAVACLVSGGIHSSTLAWMAMLQGFRVRLVHVKVGEESLRAVARLYSELSNRGDPRGLSLEVIRGDSIAGLIRGYAAAAEMPLFAGFHSTGASARVKVRGVLAPLYLMPEERFVTEYEGLGLKPYDAQAGWSGGLVPPSRPLRFGGKASDVSGVLDGLR